MRKAAATVSRSNAAEMSEAQVTQQLVSLAQQLMAVPMPSETPQTEDERDSASKASFAASVVDHTPVALSLAFRLWTLLVRSSSASLFQSRVMQVSSPRLARTLARWITSNGSASSSSQEDGGGGTHELTWIFVRLLGTLARAPGVTTVLCRPSQLEVPGAEEFLATGGHLQGLLRLSGAQIMTDELIRMVESMCGATDEEDERDEPSSIALQRAQDRSLFIGNFLGGAGRSVLLLMKHLADPLLSESTRTRILRIVFTMACARGQTGARRILLANEAKWSSHSLPQLPAVQARAQAQANLTERKRQIRWIKDLSAILRVLPSTMDAQSALNGGRTSNQRGNAAITSTHTGPIYSTQPEHQLQQQQLQQQRPSFASFQAGAVVSSSGLRHLPVPTAATSAAVHQRASLYG